MSLVLVSETPHDILKRTLKMDPPSPRGTIVDKTVEVHEEYLIKALKGYDFVKLICCRPHLLTKKTEDVFQKEVSLFFTHIETSDNPKDFEKAAKIAIFRYQNEKLRPFIPKKRGFVHSAENVIIAVDYFLWANQFTITSFHAHSSIPKNGIMLIDWFLKGALLSPPLENIPHEEIFSLYLIAEEKNIPLLIKACEQYLLFLLPHVNCYKLLGFFLEKEKFALAKKCIQHINCQHCIQLKLSDKNNLFAYLQDFCLSQIEPINLMIGVLSFESKEAAKKIIKHQIVFARVHILMLNEDFDPEDVTYLPKLFPNLQCLGYYNVIEESFLEECDRFLFLNKTYILSKRRKGLLLKQGREYIPKIQR